MKKLWFFDLDGTLADTDPDIRAAWKATLKDLGFDCPNFDRDFVAGPPIEDMAKSLFPDAYTDELGARLRKGFGDHYDHDGFRHTFEYPGILDRVREIKASGATVVIATNKRYAGALLMAKKFGWEKVFDGIYAGDMHMNDPAIGKMRKPELLGFLLAKYGVSPADAVIVGDSASDFIAARKNGIASVAVTWGYGKPDELKMADRVVDQAFLI